MKSKDHAMCALVTWIKLIAVAIQYENKGNDLWKDDRQGTKLEISEVD